MHKHTFTQMATYIEGCIYRDTWIHDIKTYAYTKWGSDTSTCMYIWGAAYIDTHGYTGWGIR